MAASIRNQSRRRDRQAMLVAVVVIQAVAAAFFVADAAGDVTQDGLSAHVLIEGTDYEFTA